jgi:hypothetical protein
MIPSTKMGEGLVLSEVKELGWGLTVKSLKTFTGNFKARVCTNRYSE